MSRKDKIQYLLISYLLEEGTISLNLPDGMVVELGILKENEHGDLKKADNYCWLIASQKDREVSMDSYNLGLKYEDEKDKLIVEDNLEESEGRKIRSFSLI